MEALFIKLLNMSITASYLVLAVVLLRLLLKKSAEGYFCSHVGAGRPAADGAIFPGEYF